MALACPHDSRAVAADASTTDSVTNAGPGSACRAHFRSLLDRFEVVTVDRAVLVTALDAGFGDYEDGVVHEASAAASVDAIVNRDDRGFDAATLPVFTSAAFLAAAGGQAS